jgi:hypothetical protein
LRYRSSISHTTAPFLCSQALKCLSSANRSLHRSLRPVLLESVYFPNFTTVAALRLFQTLDISDLVYVKHIHIKVFKDDLIPYAFDNDDSENDKYDTIFHQRAWVNILNRMPRLHDICINLVLSDYGSDVLEDLEDCLWLALSKVLQQLSTPLEIILRVKPVTPHAGQVPVTTVATLAKFLKCLRRIPRMCVDFPLDIVDTPTPRSLHNALQKHFLEYHGPDGLRVHARTCFSAPLDLTTCQLKNLRLPGIAMSGNVILETLQGARQTIETLEVTLALTPVVTRASSPLPKLKNLHIRCAEDARLASSEDYMSDATSAMESFFSSFDAPALGLLDLGCQWYVPCRSDNVLSAILAGASIVDIHLAWYRAPSTSLEKSREAISDLDKLIQELDNSRKQLHLHHTTRFKVDTTPHPFLNYDRCIGGSTSIRASTRTLELMFLGTIPHLPCGPSIIQYPRLESLHIHDQCNNIHVITNVISRLELPQLRILRISCLRPQSEALLCAILAKLPGLPSLAIIKGKFGCSSASPFVKHLTSLCDALDIELDVQWEATDSLINVDA